MSAAGSVLGLSAFAAGASRQRIDHLLRRRHRHEPIRCLRRQIEPSQQQFRGFDRSRRFEPGDRGVGQRTHDDRAVEQSFRVRHRRQHRDLSAAARLPEDRDQVRIAAEPMELSRTHPRAATTSSSGRFEVRAKRSPVPGSPASHR